MRVQLVTRSQQKAPVKRTVVADWLRIGRNASCEIHLPDPRVPLEQGMIVNREGLVYIEGEQGSLNVTRKSVRSERLRVGDSLDVGPYKLTIKQPPQGFDAAVEIELVRALEATEDFRSRTSLLTLGSLGLTKRGWAWILAIGILAMFLALPAARVLDLPWRDTAKPLGIGDSVWNPGPVMLAHQPIERKCETCHEVAFEHVKDRACLECHARIGQHVGPQMRPAVLFDGARCTSCHSDHKGAKPTHRDDDRFCVDCHKDLAARVNATEVSKATDFARDHPAFRLSLPTESGVKRVRQGAQAVEQSNLAFPHAVHLDPAGVRSPLQGRTKLECRSCHAPDASRRSFEPISMAKHCQECHPLQFEPAVTTREVPHGKPGEALQVVEEFYANLALKGTRDSFQKAFGVPGEGLLRRAGAEPGTGEREKALALAQRKAKQVGDELFEVRVCATCHAVSRHGEEWKIAPVRANNAWMPQARFDHKAHAQVKCADCHDVAKSKKSSDVAMPKIEACRECHGGSKPVASKVTSNCLLCHGFHDARHPWDPNFQPKTVTRVAGGADAR